MNDAATTPITLRSRIAALQETAAPLDLAHAIGIVVPLAAELAEQHRQGYQFFVYPSALEQGDDGHFHASDRAATPPSEPRDTACLAPELAATNPGSSGASVYAIGAILYELITLRPVGPQMRRPSELVGGIPEELEMILSKALVRDPEHRPDDLNALAQALYQLNTTATAPPPPADVSHLDHDGNIDVDISLSLMPPPPKAPQDGEVIQGMSPQAPLPPGVGQPPAATQQHPTPQEPTSEDLAGTKARLEADPRPRYVVVKDGMDHGPFSALELLQQIASHTFLEDDVIRDSVAGTELAIKDSSDFAPFARHARMGRHEKEERAALQAAVAQESRSTTGKALVGVIALGALLAAGGVWFVTSRGAKSDKIEVIEETAANVESDVGLKVKKKKKRRGGGVVGKSGGIPQLGGGMSCAAAQNAYVEQMNIGGPKGQADLTAGQFQAILGNGTYLNACGVPQTTSVNICAAIQNGRAVGVTVTTKPSSPKLNACVARKVRAMSFPSHPKLDVTRTTF